MLQTMSGTTAVDLEEQDDTAAGLYFQRCRWCGTAAYQRLLCTCCGSTDFEQCLSTGEGVICVHRNVSAEEDRWPVQMGEGFVVRCRVLGARETIRPGTRVRLASAPGHDGPPVVELCDVPVPHYWG